MKTKLGTVYIPETKTRYKAIEDYLHLQAMVSYETHQRKVGAYFSRKSKNHLWTVWFAFKCRGLHTFMTESEVKDAIKRLERGLLDFPERESPVFHFRAVKTDTDRQQELERVKANAPSPELSFLLTSEQARSQELAEAGNREPKELFIYVPFTADASVVEYQDWAEQIIGKFWSALSQFRGEASRALMERTERILDLAWTNGYLFWEMLLVNTLGLEVKPLTVDELWNHAWYWFNETPSISVPQEIVVTEQGIRQKVNSTTHPTSLLVADAVPTFDRRWVFHKGQFWGFLSFWEKPGDWEDATAQLTYLSSVIGKDFIYDCEIFTQITPANHALLTTNLQRLIKQNTVASHRADTLSNVDVSAQYNQKESVQAQESILTGGRGFHTATIIAVRRDTLEELDRACQLIKSCFMRPAWVERETEVAWKLFLQCVPFNNDKLLSTALGNRRLVYTNQELPGLLPLTTTLTPDASGVEFIAEDGGTPVGINLFDSEGKHLGIYGTTRSGKSVTLAYIMMHALSRQIPVVALDYPKPDGTSTYTDLARFLYPLVEYFDISSECLNLLERPDLSQYDPVQRASRFDSWQDYVTQGLLAMVTGEGGSDEVLRATIRVLLASILQVFLADEAILDRYKAAEAAGIRSATWQEMPTLRDYLPFCRRETIESQVKEILNTASSNRETDGADNKEVMEGTSRFNWGYVERALEQIQIKLRYWAESRIGKAISSPSTISSNALMLVFALTEVQQSEDAAILGLCAYSAAMRRALSYPMSFFGFDESPILFEFREIAAMVGRTFANGLKSGIRVVLTAQDPDTIAASASASKILQNTHIKMVGRIVKEAVPSFERIFHYPHDVIIPCQNFTPNRTGIYTQWLLDYNGRFTKMRFYPPYFLLGAVANNRDEQRVRAAIIERSRNKWEGLAAFSYLLVESMRSGVKLEDLYRDRYGTGI